MNVNFSMRDKRPAVWIFVLQPVPEETIMPILWGLEEEGIPTEQRDAAGGSAEILAKEAADGSPLNVGIGIHGTEGEVVLHHRDLPGDAPLFSFGAMDLNPTMLRILGMNAARLVKGDPLVFEGNQSLVDADVLNFNQMQQDRLENLIAGVLMEILEKG